jgi:hypothetical protein
MNLCHYNPRSTAVTLAQVLIIADCALWPSILAIVFQGVANARIAQKS